MGAIVRIMDNDIRRPVAMKVNLSGEDPERIDRFVEEAQVTGQLEHPNIVPVHELGMNLEGKVYFTMKLVKGESLESVVDGVAEDKPGYREAYPLSHLLQIFLKTCDAVAFAHSKGVVHRDLKPENVMVGRFGEVLVMDWGLAKVLGRDDPAREVWVQTARSEQPAGRTMEGEVFGTPSYMAPEQAQGKVDAVDEASDVFALGGILYKILTHEAPYSGKNVTEVLMRAEVGTVLPPRKRTPSQGIPPVLESICLKAMATKKPDRYASVGDLIADIRAYLDHRLVPTHRYGLGSRFLHFVQRHPAGSLAGGVAGILLTLGGALAGVLLQRADSERAKAREKEALAAAERSRAEMAVYRAALAEKGQAEAEGRALGAETALKKSRRVSAVLRSANVELGRAHGEMKRSYFSPAPEEEKKEIRERLWAKVEAFEKNVQEDTASRATWLAAKGWLMRLAGREEEAFALFEASRQTDKDIAYGWLFEGMIWLSKYLALQPLPEAVFSKDNISFHKVPPETAAMREVRERFEKNLEQARKAPVWGESASEAFDAVLTGFRAIQEGRLESAEKGLTTALSLPETVWMRDEVLLARAKVRYLRGDASGGIEDARRVIRNQPENADAYYYLGISLSMKGTVERGRTRDPQASFQGAIEAFTKGLGFRGKSDRKKGLTGRAICYGNLGAFESERGMDPGPSFRKAIEDCNAILAADPDDAPAFSLRGNVYRGIGDFETRAGRDPREAYREAIESLGEALKRDSTFAEAYNNRGLARMHLADFEGALGKDVRAAYGEALEDFEEALARDKEMVMARMNRGVATLGLGRQVRMLGGDPRDTLQKAIAIFDAAMKGGGEYAGLHSSRATAFTQLGDVEAGLNLDPRPSYEKAIAGFREALRRNPDLIEAYTNRGITYSHLGAWEGRRGVDPRPSFAKAVADFGEALKRNPRNAEALNNRGGVHLRTGMILQGAKREPTEALGKAVADYTEALRWNPALVPTYRNRAKAYVCLASHEGGRGRDPRDLFGKAAADYNESLKRDPQNIAVHYDLAMVYSRVSEFEAAQGLDPRAAFDQTLSHFRASLPLERDAPLAHYQMGSVWIRRATHEEGRGKDPRDSLKNAIGHFREAVAKSPGLWQARLKEGTALRRLGYMNRAVEAFEGACKAGGDRFPVSKKLLAEARTQVSRMPWLKGLEEALEVSRRGEAGRGARAGLEKAFEAARKAGAYDDASLGKILRGIHADCAEALAADFGPGEPEEETRRQALALDHLEKALELGYPDLERLRTHPAFATLKDLPRFKDLLKTWEGKRDGK
jgi:tetratricopeptide (TPR) repeat protein